MRRGLMLLAGLLLMAMPCAAGVTYTSVSEVESSVGEQNMKQRLVMQFWMSGGNAKSQIVESANPIMPAGSYMVNRGDGTSMFMVNPAGKTYWTFDVASMMAGVSKMMKMEDAKWERVSQEDGGEVSGVPTQHYHYRFSYTMVMTLGEQVRRTAVSMEQEFWVTDKLDRGLQYGQAYRFSQALAGFSPEMEQMMRAEMAEMHGFPLKTVQATTMDMPGAGKVVSKSTTVISDIQTVNLPDNIFDIPADFTRSEPPALFAGAAAAAATTTKQNNH